MDFLTVPPPGQGGDQFPPGNAQGTPTMVQSCIANDCLPRASLLQGSTHTSPMSKYREIYLQELKKVEKQLLDKGTKLWLR